MERVVADANILVKWFIEEDYSREALLLRGDHVRGCILVAAPSYALPEFGREYSSSREGI